MRRISRWMRKCSSECVCIDFCFRLGKSDTETCEMPQAAFGESCLSRLKTIEWYSRFKSGRRSFEDDPRPGRPSTSHIEGTVACVREIIRTDRRLPIREVAEKVTVLCVIFWVFPRRLIIECRRFGTLYLFHLQRLDMKCEVW